MTKKRKVRVVYTISLTHGGDIVLNLGPGESSVEVFNKIVDENISSLSEVFPDWLFKRCAVEVTDDWHEEINNDS